MGLHNYIMVTFHFINLKILRCFFRFFSHIITSLIDYFKLREKGIVKYNTFFPLLKMFYILLVLAEYTEYYRCYYKH